MKISYTVNDRCKMEVELQGLKDTFQFLAMADTMFGLKRCGNCESPNLSFQHKTPKGYDYYSVRCDDCRHEFKFGQQKETGRLFPKGWEPPFSGGEGTDRDDQETDYQQDEPPRASRPPRREEEAPARAAAGDGIPW